MPQRISIFAKYSGPKTEGNYRGHYQSSSVIIQFGEGIHDMTKAQYFTLAALSFFASMCIFASSTLLIGLVVAESGINQVLTLFLSLLPAFPHFFIALRFFRKAVKEHTRQEVSA
jgi:hypothetical protein